MIYFDNRQQRVETGIKVLLKSPKPIVIQEVRVMFIADVVHEKIKKEIPVGIRDIGQTGTFDYQLIMDMNDVTQEAKKHNSVLDNIGLLVIEAKSIDLVRRMAVILSKSNNSIVLTFVASQGQ